MAKASTKVTKKRKVIVDSVGEAHISASFNNIIISLTNKKG
ncbi:MAG: 30S ribosomal protein S11, partial [Maribacter dokdonensis]